MTLYYIQFKCNILFIQSSAHGTLFVSNFVLFFLAKKSMCYNTLMLSKEERNREREEEKKTCYVDALTAQQMIIIITVIRLFA